jgi:acyl carrier protein
MSWTHGWWTRISSPIDVGRDSLARLVGRVGGGQAVCANDDDARLRDIEPTLRRIIGDSLGVKAERIAGHAALVADLGIDPLDVLDVMTRVESVVGIAYPEGEIDALRTFEDLVLVTRALLSVRLAAEQPAPAPAQGRLRVSSAGGATLERVVMLTPYDCETIADDLALSQGSDDREITVTSGAPSSALAELDAALLSSRLGGRRTTVRRIAPARMAQGARPPVAEERTPATNAAALRVARHAVDLLECLSHERGMAALYLASSGALYAPEIQAARAQTNRRIAAFRTIVQTYGPLLGSALRARLNAAIARLGDLGAIRAVADELTLQDTEILDAYHDVGRALTRYVWTLELGQPDPALVPQQMCLSALVAATEAGGTERAMIGCALARDVLTPTDRADVAALIAQQGAQLDLALSNASGDIATLLGVCVRDPLFASVADYERRLMGARPDVAPGMDPTAWFRAMTGKLERLHAVELRQLDRLMRDSMRQSVELRT